MAKTQHLLQIAPHLTSPARGEEFLPPLMGNVIELRGKR